MNWSTGVIENFSNKWEFVHSVHGLPNLDEIKLIPCCNGKFSLDTEQTGTFDRPRTTFRLRVYPIMIERLNRINWLKWQKAERQTLKRQKLSGPDSGAPSLTDSRTDRTSSSSSVAVTCQTLKRQKLSGPDSGAPSLTDSRTDRTSSSSSVAVTCQTLGFAAVGGDVVVQIFTLLSLIDHLHLATTCKVLWQSSGVANNVNRTDSWGDCINPKCRSPEPFTTCNRRCSHCGDRNTPSTPSTALGVDNVAEEKHNLNPAPPTMEAEFTPPPLTDSRTDPPPPPPPPPPPQALEAEFTPPPPVVGLEEPHSISTTPNAEHSNCVAGDGPVSGLLEDVDDSDV
jgi:hypothetical protein